MTALRLLIWERDKGLCCFCHLPVAFEEGHMAHKRGKAMWGDSPDNIKGPSHFDCHGDSHNCGGKPCPPKA